MRSARRTSPGVWSPLVLGAILCALLFAVGPELATVFGANTLTHKKVSTKPDPTDSSLVGAGDWNAEHSFSGGSDNYALIYDSTQTDRVRWVSVPPNAVAKAGDTMTGLLTLSADPSTALQAATKQYVDAVIAAHGQARLTLSGANLLLSPLNGNKILINSAVQTIPAAGVTLGAGGLIASTTYYIYAYMSGGTMTLEASTTTHATQAATGVEIKSGDGTRTLVGMARTTSGTAWADSATQRFVRTWFQDPGIGGVNNFTANRSTTSTTYVELNTEIRIEFLVWTSEVVEVFVTGMVNNETLTQDTSTGIGFDGTNQENAVTGVRFTAVSGINPIGLALAKTGLSEGYHYATVLGAVAGGTGNWYGSAYSADTTYVRRVTLSLRAKR